MSWFHKLERRLEPLAIPHVLLAIVAGQTFFYLAELIKLVERSRLVLAGALAAQGEWWRIFSFVLVPPDAHWALIAFALYMVYFLGNSLEEEMGVLRLNLFLLCGWALTVGVAMIAPTMVVNNAFIGGSVFLAFAYLNPTYVFYVFLIIPVQVRWLALITWIFYAISFFLGGLGGKLLVLASTGNFMLFFGARMLRDLRTGRQHAESRRRREVARKEADAAGPQHRCVACGKDSDAFPEEDFRYRADGNCYCAEHLRAVLAQEAQRS